MHKNDRKVLIRLLGLVLILCAAFCVIVGVLYLLDRRQSGTRQTSGEASAAGGKPDTEEDYTGYLQLYGQDYLYSHDIATYLFLGTDASGHEDGNGDAYQGSMGDYINLLVVDKTDQTYASLLLNRDTMTDVQLLQKDGIVPESQVMQLCCAHWYGGDRQASCENMVQAVSQMLGGLWIDGYYAVSMKNIPQINALVGGVTLTVQGDFSRCDKSLVEGETVTLTDEQAYHYIHERINADDGENLSRMKRQRQYMEAFVAQAKEKMRQEPSFGVDAIDQLKGAATTDISGSRLSKLVRKLDTYQDLGVFQFDGETRIGQALDDGLDHTEFYPQETSVVGVMTQLYHLVRDDGED